VERKSIHVSTESDNWWLAGSDVSNDTSASIREGIGYVEPIELRSNKSTRFVFLKSELGILVQATANEDEPFLIILGLAKEVRGVERS
jgi:hypothetical protein